MYNSFINYETPAIYGYLVLEKVNPIKMITQLTANIALLQIQ